MSEHQKETVFLRHIISYDDTDERRDLEEKIAQVQRDQRCVQRVASGAALCAALAMAGLVYCVILQENFPYSGPRFVVRVLSDLGLASLICLAAFAGLLAAYRKKLNRLREQCRQLITRLLESRVGGSHLTTLRGSRPGSGDRDIAPATAEVGGSLVSLDSLRALAADGENRIIDQRNSAP